MAGMSGTEMSVVSAAFHCGDGLELEFHNPSQIRFDVVAARLQDQMPETWIEIGRWEAELASASWHPRSHQRLIWWND